METRPGLSHFGEAVQEAEAAQAERLVLESLTCLGWSEADLQARLSMGSRGQLAWLLQQCGKANFQASSDPWLPGI